jgi:DNA-directed RNA polymerase beta subunit
MINLSKNDMFEYLKKYVYSFNLIEHNINSFNEFVEFGLRDIITNIFKIEDTLYFDKKNITVSTNLSKLKNIAKLVSHDDTGAPGASTEDRHFYKSMLLSKINYKIEFFNVQFSKPKTINPITNELEYLTPYICRKNNQTYSSAINIDIKINIDYVGTGGQIESTSHTIKNILIGYYPIMVKSIICNIANATNEELINVYKEDPNDLGGYFIINGVEWCIDSSESILFNSVRIFNNQFQNELTRAEFISKPGDGFENSREIILLFLNNGLVTIRLVGSNDLYEELDIPFYIIYRIYGVLNDREIIENVILEDPTGESLSKENGKLCELLYNCLRYNDKKFKFHDFVNNYNQEKVIVQFGKLLLKSLRNLPPNIVNNNYIINNILTLFDNSLLPHIGIDSSIYTRKKKLLYLGIIIRKLLLTNLGLLNETDRDSYNSKRVHTAGISYSKSFKTIFRTTFVNSIKKQFNEYMLNTKNKSDININNIFNKISGYEKLQSSIEKSITMGNKEIYYDKNLKPIKNNLSSQTLIRKNQMNTLSSLRVIHSSSSGSNNQAKRAKAMRSVHPSFTGYICPAASSADGEKVGLSKQLAITARITSINSSFIVKDKIKEMVFSLEPYIVLREKPRSDFLKYTLVYINGDIMGYVKDATIFLKKIRNMRLNGEIYKHTTIYFNILINEIMIWCDVGRLVRPLFRVFNNLDELDALPREEKPSFVFKQWIKLTKTHVVNLKSNKIEFADIEKDGIVEYISAEESENCYICYNIEQFNKDHHEITRQYTHVDIEEVIYGITALTAPYLNHTLPTRITYQSTQTKQSCGWYVLNPEFRFDKKRFFQIYCEQPVVKTIVNDLMYPNGQNLMVAMMCYSGFNQEDSTIVNKSLVDNGYLAGYNYTFYTIKITDFNTEFIRLITPADKVQKNAANYDLLDEQGVIRKGSIVTKNTVLVCKLVLVNRKENIYRDVSLIYHDEDTYEVDNVEVTYYNKLENKIEYIKVRLKTHRYILKGDKLSTRSGNKNIISYIMPPNEMPFLESTGEIPDMIVNPHSIPTRMVIGQLIESLMAKLYVRKCEQVDGTAFCNLDLKAIQQELEKYGLDGFGLERMVCGRTGRRINCMVFHCPVYIQRLQKFAFDEAYVVTRGPIDEITKQPKEGRQQSGGLKVGEMEKDCIAAYGCNTALAEKFLHGPDKTIIYCCRTCGNTKCVVNTEQDIKACYQCNELADIVAVETSAVTNVLLEYLRIAGIDTRVILES